MRIFTHKKFDKAFKKIPPKLHIAFYQALEIFENNKTDKRLHNHSLTGTYLGYRSFDVSSDVRVIFKEIDNEDILFINIGTHSQLYG